MNDDNQNEERGRRISRRGRGGFAFSNSGLSDSTTTEAAGNLNERVQEQATQPVASLPEAMPTNGSVVAGNPSEDFNPRDRLAQVRNRATEYEKEYRLGLLHRLLMRRIPIDEIASQLGVSIATVYRDREELKTRLRQDANALDINEMIGDSKGFYEEVGAMSMRAASNANLPMPMRLAAMRTALASKNDQHRFFQTAGVYDVLRFRMAQDGTGVSDVKRLMEQAERVLQGETLEFSNAVHEVVDSGDHENLEL